MSPVSGLLDSEAVQQVLAHEHECALGDDARLADLRPEIDAAKAAGDFTYELYPKDVYLAVEPAMGRFLYLAAKSMGGGTFVEFGTSFGISTIYLAAAAKETGGRVVGSEMEPAKAARAETNLKEAGLAEYAEIRVGDALETLKGLEGPVDLLFLDGWKDLYIPVLETMLPVLRPGALVLADNINTFPEELAPYMDAVNAPGGPFRSTLVPFASGLACSVYRENAGRKWPAGTSGTLAGIARKEKRRGPMELLSEVEIAVDGGLARDSRGRFPERAVTVLAREGWEAALAELNLAADTGWTLRRANLLTEGVDLPRAAGGVFQVGGVVLEVTGETRPCSRMDEARPGLLKALGPDWRGGATCRVLSGGTIRTGDAIRILISPPELTRRPLPG